AVRPEHVAACGQLGHQLGKGVDLAVEDDDHRARLVVERLTTAAEVDARETPMTEADARLDGQSVLVGSPPPRDVVHGGEQARVHRTLLSQIEDTDDSAHAWERSLSPVGPVLARRPTIIRAARSARRGILSSICKS